VTGAAATIATELFLTKRAVEKHINAIFAKLNMPEENKISRRVVATLVFLSHTTTTPQHTTN
jgi:DNA-binding NarL/FixJ family response regulator